MSKYVQKTYDVTDDSVKLTLDLMREFYEKNPMPENEDDPRPAVSIYFDKWMEGICKGWKELEYLRDPYNYSSQMNEHCDKSDKTLRKYYNR